MPEPKDIVVELEARLLTAVKGLVRRHDAVKLEALHKGATMLVFSLHVHRSDYGSLIGRAGAHVSALRTLLRAWGKQHGLTVYLDVADVRPQRDNQAPTSPATE